MLLSEIFEHLTHGELAHLYIGGGGTHELGIDPLNYPKMATMVNMGLIELHKRFPIKQDQVIIQLYSHITDYFLRYDYAQSNVASTKPYKYIIDYSLATPFQDNVLLIRHVYDELGAEFPLNDLDQTTSLFTPQHDVLQVPWPDNENHLAIVYRAGPKKINHIGLSRPELVEVELPEQYLEALCNYVGYRMFLSLNLGEGNAEANSLKALFDDSCARISNLGLYIADSNENLKFGDNKWP